MAVITRWSYKRAGRKAGFHCIRKREDPGDEDDVIEGAD